MKKIKIALVRGLMSLMSKLPLDWLYGLGNCVTWFAKRVLHYREGVVMTNLARSFPEYNHGDLEWVADLFYKHIGEMVAEAIWSG